MLPGVGQGAKKVDVGMVDDVDRGRGVRKDDFPRGYSDYKKDTDKNNHKSIAMSMVNN